MGKKIVGIAACGCGRIVHKMWVTHEVWGATHRGNTMPSGVALTDFQIACKDRGPARHATNARGGGLPAPGRAFVAGGKHRGKPHPPRRDPPPPLPTLSP